MVQLEHPTSLICNIIGYVTHIIQNMHFLSNYLVLVPHKNQKRDKNGAGGGLKTQNLQ